MGLVVDLLAALTFLTDLCLLLAFSWIFHDRVSGRRLSDRYEVFERVEETLSRYYRELSFLVALVATSGSLYFSNILHWEPCRLCWYQRIMMYPLVIVIGVGILFGKKDVKDYVLPLSITGAAIATFHYPVQRLAELHSGCSQFATSCSMSYTMKFGYVTVPMMALTAFLAIIFLMWKFSDRN